MRKTTLAIAAIFLFTMVSCNKNNNPSDHTPPAAEVSAIYFKEAKINLADDLDSVLCLDKSGNHILAFGEKNGGYIGYITDNAFADCRNFHFGARESVFVDMYDFIDNDPKLSRDDFLDGYLEAIDFNGKLLEISPGFTVNTMTVKDKFLNGLTSWTFDEMIDVINSRPEGMGLIPNFEIYPRSVYMLDMIDYCSFIDFEKASCCYDSDEFINIVKNINENEDPIKNTELFEFTNQKLMKKAREWNNSCTFFILTLFSF